MTSPHLAFAFELHALRYTPIPVKEDGSKAPAVAWREAQDAVATREQVQSWFTNYATDGIGLLCGAPSSGLVMIEIEGRDPVENFRLLEQIDDLMAITDLKALWERVDAGWTEMSPGGGVHWFVRVGDSPTGRNEVLARDVDGKVKAETRAAGGMTIIAPSGETGRHVHPTGKPWLRVNGGPETVETLTRDDLERLLAVFRALDDQTVEVQPLELAGPRQRSGLLPGADFNLRATWKEVLTPHGWRLSSRGNYLGWTRPGKDTGTSATTGLTPSDLLNVFSTSTVLPVGKPMTKFAAYTTLNHAGDFTAAARDLAARGFGDRVSDRQESDGQVPWTPLEERELPPFPLQALRRLEEYVAAIARATETSPDMAATAALGAVSSVIGGRVAVDAPTQGNWREPLVLWTLIVAGPGEGDRTPSTGPGALRVRVLAVGVGGCSVPRIGPGAGSRGHCAAGRCCIRCASRR